MWGCRYLRCKSVSFCYVTILLSENPTSVLINNWPEDAMKGDNFVIAAKSIVQVASTDAHIAITKLITSYYERKLDKGKLDVTAFLSMTSRLLL